MNKEQFKEKAYAHLTNALPDLNLKINGKSFAIDVIKEGVSEPLSLENLYLDSKESSFEQVMKATVGFLSSLDDKHADILNFNRDKITPIIRSTMHMNDDMVFRELTNDLSVGYAVEHEDYIKYVDREMLNDFFKEEELYDAAMLNTLKRGWLNHQTEEHSGAGRLLLFRHFDDEFLFQFFLQDMYEYYLGAEFYLSMPTKHIAIVLIPNNINKDGVLEGILKLKEFAVKLHGKESYPISEKIYHVINGTVSKIG